MTSAKAAAAEQVYAALDAGVSLGTVYQDAPANSQGSLVIMGEITSSPFGGKNDPDRRLSLTIITQVEAEELQPLLDLQQEVEAALDGKTFTADPWTLSVGIEDDVAALGDDGVTYVGSSAFTILALRD